MVLLGMIKYADMFLLKLNGIEDRNAIAGWRLLIPGVPLP